MQKQAWTYSLTGAALGAFALLLRWLQREIIIDEAGLPRSGAAISVLLVLFLFAAAAALWILSGRLGGDRSQEEPEEALAVRGPIPTVLLAVAGAAALGGALLMVVQADSLFLRVSALAGVLAAAVLILYPSLPRWGGFGAGLSLVPVVFFSLWLVVSYKDNAVDPIVWNYGMLILAVSSSLFAVYRLCGYLYYRIRSRRAVFGCALAVVLCLSVLMDDLPLGMRVLLAGWAVGFAALCWVLWSNMLPEDGPAGDGIGDSAEATE